MTARIAIYQLSHKFVNEREDIPEDAKQVVYYALAIGHHIGVLDCFSSVTEIPFKDFCTWLENLPPGNGRKKLEGVIKWGEIEINQSHVNMLLPLIKADDRDNLPWLGTFSQCLENIRKEPALYLMLRRHN